jgi:hypothetical protein
MTDWNLLLLVSTFAASVALLSFMFSLRTQQYKTTSYLTHLLGRQYGFVRTKFVVRYVIGEDGSAQVSYNEAFVATNEELLGIEHWTRVSTDPTLTRDFRLEIKSGAKQKTEIIPRPTLVTPTKLFYQLLFSPPLQPRESVEYSYYIYGPPGMFLLSPQQVQARGLPFDYVSMEIAYPTNRLEMEFVFPPNIYVERLEQDVWLGDGRLRLKKEYNRLEKEGAKRLERQGETLVARLTVDYPILGLKYAITWTPVQRSQEH